MNSTHGRPSRSDPRATIIARILDRDQAMLTLATQLESAVPAAQPDLTMRQLYALLLVSARPRHVGEVATLLSVTISSASGLIDRLVRARLVSRQSGEEDRRVVICRITDDGELALRHFLEIGRLRLERVLNELSGEELIVVERALEMLIGAARTVVARSSPVATLNLGSLPSG